MSLVRSRIANWFGRRSSSTSTPAWQDRPVRLETLENRCLLSASVTQAPVSAATLPDVPELDANDNGFSQDEFDARGTFTGELKLRRRDDEGRRTYALTLRITSQDEFGNVSGTLSGEQFGETTFDGIFAPARKWFYHLTLPFEGESDSDGRFGGTDARGLFDGHFNPRNFDQVSGGIRDEDNRKFGSFKLNRASSPGDGDGDGDGDGGGNDDDGTQATGAFPSPGGAQFAVLEVNAENGVTLANGGNDTAVARDLLDDFNVSGQDGADSDGDSDEDSDDADAIVRYGVDSIDFGAGTAGAAQFQTLTSEDHDNIALEAIGVVTVADDGSTTEVETSGTFTVGIRSTGAARLSVIRAGGAEEEVLALAGNDTDNTEQASVTLNNDDHLRLVYAETDTPEGQEQLILYTVEDDGDPNTTDVETPIGAEGSPITITAPTTANQPGPADDGDGSSGDGDGDGVGGGTDGGTDGGGTDGGGTDGGTDGGGVSTGDPVRGEDSIVGTHEGTLRLTANSTDADSTGRNRAITFNVASHNADGGLAGTIEVAGLAYDENGDGTIDAADDADGDGNADLNFTGFINGDRFTLVLIGSAGGGAGVVDGAVRQDGDVLVGSVLFEAGSVFASGEFNTDRVSDSPADPADGGTDPLDPDGGANAGGGATGDGTGTDGGTDGGAAPVAAVGGVARNETINPDEDTTNNDGIDIDAAKEDGSGTSDPLLGPGNADGGPGNADGGAGNVGGDGIGDSTGDGDGGGTGTGTGGSEGDTGGGSTGGGTEGGTDGGGGGTEGDNGGDGGGAVTSGGGTGLIG